MTASTTGTGATGGREGTRGLARSAAVWLASLAFCVVYLLSLLVGGSWTTALLRGLAAAVVVRLVGPPLLYLLVDTVLAAVAESKVDEEADES